MYLSDGEILRIVVAVQLFPHDRQVALEWVRVSGDEVACKSLARSERALSSVLASAS